MQIFVFLGSRKFNVEYSCSYSMDAQFIPILSGVYHLSWSKTSFRYRRHSFPKILLQSLEFLGDVDVLIPSRYSIFLLPCRSNLPLSYSLLFHGIFFTSKNGLIIILQWYRMRVILAATISQARSKCGEV